MQKFYAYRKYLILFFVLLLHVLLPLLILISLFVYNQKQLVLSWGEQNNILLSRIVIERQEKYLGHTKRLLALLGETKAVQDSNPEMCNELVRRIMATNPLYANILVADKYGVVWCSAAPLTKPTNVKDMLHFQSAMRSGTFSFGEYTMGVVTGLPVFHIAYPVVDANGSTVNVAVVSMDLKKLNSTLSATSLPDGSTMGITDNQGRILAFYPDSSYVGKNISNQTLFSGFLKDPSQSTFVMVGIDGVKRLHTFSKSPDLLNNSIYTFIGLPTTLLDEAANKTTFENLIVVFVVLLVMAVAIFVDWKFFIKKYIAITNPEN